MPKKQIIKMGIIVVILSFICMYIYDNYKVEVETVILAEPSDKVELREYFTDSKNSYYLYDLDDIVVDFNDRILKLDRALETKQIDNEFILNSVIKKYSLNDEKINFYQNDEFSLLECKNINNKTYYIFGKTIDYKESLCNNNPYVISFTKVYHVLDKSYNQNSNITYLTLKDSNEVETIKINNPLVDNIVVGVDYTFEFASMNTKVDDNIKDVFTNNLILDIR